MSEEAMDAGIEVKVEPYDGTYECLFCGDSVRGWAALACSQCNSNPFHRPGSACDPDPKYAEVCPTCGRKTVEVWMGASARCAEAAVMIDLTALEASGACVGAKVGALTGHGAREDAVPAATAVGGAVVAADVQDEAGQGARGGRAGAGSGSSGKGKEPAGAEAGPEAAGGDSAATTRAGAGAVGGGGKGNWRADNVHNGSARARRDGRVGQSSGGGRGGGRSERSGGSGGKSGAGEQRGEGGSKRAAPDGDEGGSSAGEKRARARKSATRQVSFSRMVVVVLCANSCTQRIGACDERASEPSAWWCACV